VDKEHRPLGTDTLLRVFPTLAFKVEPHASTEWLAVSSASNTSASSTASSHVAMPMTITMLAAAVLGMVLVANGASAGTATSNTSSTSSKILFMQGNSQQLASRPCWPPRSSSASVECWTN